MSQLLQHIKSKYKTQAKAARMYGVSASWLNKILKGTGRPPENMLNQLRNEGFDTASLVTIYGISLPETIETANDYLELIRSYQRMIDNYERRDRANHNMINALNNTIKELRANNLLLFKENTALKNFHNKKVEEISYYVKEYLDKEKLKALRQSTM
jgi:transcriptional regulator with XRE-family HTH domain